MCNPKMPDIPEYEEPKQPPSAPHPHTPDASTLPPPMSTGASADDDVKIKKKKSKKELAARSKGLSEFRIKLDPKNEGGKGDKKNKGSVNIPK